MDTAKKGQQWFYTELSYANFARVHLAKGMCVDKKNLKTSLFQIYSPYFNSAQAKVLQCNQLFKVAALFGHPKTIGQIDTNFSFLLLMQAHA